MEQLNILTSNAGALCSYGFIRSLEKISSKIILFYQQEKPIILAHSKFINKSYHVKVPNKGWEQGDFVKENSPEEEIFIQEILNICHLEDIDIVIPSTDKEMFILSKNKERFFKKEIIILVSDFESIEKATDKYNLILAAKATGFPYPESYLPNSMDDAMEKAKIIGYPLIIKPTTGEGARGVQIINNQDELKEKVQELREKYGWPIIQEYIAGDIEPSINLIIDNNNNPIFHYSLKKLRYVAASRSTCIEIMDPLPETQKAIKLVQHLGLKGFIAIQTKYDIKTQQHKIIEINARWGANSAILLRVAEKLDVNPILLNIKAFQETESSLPLQTLKPGFVGISLIEDLLAIRKYFSMKSNISQQRLDNPLPKFSELLNSYKYTYIRKDKTFDFFTRAILDDTKMAFSAYKRLIKMAVKDEGMFVPWGGIERRGNKNE
ncbi:ATP-grasp domain-containing protein [Viridibacillus arvi]|uniref:ATP-binding protein n=1 Tax=Viridibacillus arvi TaxID=263475 RepID=UPI003D00400B